MTDATPEDLRRDFTEFASTVTYPDDDVTFWLGIAIKMLRGRRWGNMLAVGQELYAAHNLVLEYQARKSAATGAPPGVATGATTAKAVDRVSVSFDANATLELEAGHWNYTTYGQRFIRYARMFGAGAYAL